MKNFKQNYCEFRNVMLNGDFQDCLKYTTDKVYLDFKKSVYFADDFTRNQKVYCVKVLNLMKNKNKVSFLKNASDLEIFKNYLLNFYEKMFEKIKNIKTFDDMGILKIKEMPKMTVKEFFK